MNIHIKAIHEKPKTQECDICGKHLYHLARHKLWYHTDRPRIKCDRCGEEVEQHYMKKHLIRHEQGIHACKLCDKEYKSAPGLQAHHRITHNGERLKCHFCSRKFNYNSTRLIHTRNHHPEKCEKLRDMNRANHWKRVGAKKGAPKKKVVPKKKVGPKKKKKATTTKNTELVICETVTNKDE